MIGILKLCVSRSLLLVLAAAHGSASAQPAPARPAPVRIGSALGVPSWLRIGLEHQARFEHLDEDFRAGATGDATALVLRTLVLVEAARGPAVAGLELEDARAYVSDETPLNTTIVNPVELLQAYVGVRANDLLGAGGVLEARLGRITIDLGTRRLVARNRFRNTINGFTGIDAAWTSPGAHVGRAFAAVPVTRLPADDEGLRDNEIVLDEENTDALLWGVAYGSPRLARGTRIELFAVGFHERDGELASRNRQLVTLGVRWWKKPAPGTVDFELEVMPQAGTSRATANADDVTDLDHRAVSTHAEVGISPSITWKPRIALQHDHATGDDDPGDERMDRFDPLFGARRFDFGPTGLYGAFARINLTSPGLRVSIAPTKAVDAFASYRVAWLASARDAWSTAGLRDPSGGSGTYLGQQVEVMVRWRPLPDNLAVEAGAAYLRRGEFARTAPDARDTPASYVYTQLTLTL